MIREEERENIRKSIERIKALRRGENPRCSKCKDGIMVAIGDYRTTTAFHCTRCDNQIIMN